MEVLPFHACSLEISLHQEEEDMGIGRASFSLVTAGRGKGGRGRKGQGVKEGSDRMAALKADQRCLDRASWVRRRPGGWGVG